MSKESTQFLEMKLDSKLDWEEHINKLRAKAKRALNTYGSVPEKTGTKMYGRKDGR